MAAIPATQLTSRLLLEKIDKLTSCGVGDFIELPQLVVVGNQSSGKSSVLEGLTKLPFPRDSGLCTRFTTQITFRRSDVDNIRVSIMPGPLASSEHEKHLRSWSRPDVQALDQTNFAEIILDAQTRMGLGSNGGSSFSEDIFKIEVSGPQQEHFSIIDVPGIFETPEEGRTTEADCEMVKRMVTLQMNNKRSVMLAVVAANVDTATQGILKKAAAADPDGIRTLGILTKPDLVADGEEQSVLDHVDGKRHKLKLGWHIVRNTGQKDLSNDSFDRDATEAAFFRDTSPWNTLRADKVGIQSLKKKLEDILGRHIKREFPQVRREMMKRLDAARKNLQSLGAPRCSPHEIRAYLTNVAAKFEQVTNEALHTRYTKSVFDQHEELRLPTLVVNRQDKFAEEMSLYGHTYAFNIDEGDKSSSAHPEESDDDHTAGKEFALAVSVETPIPELRDIVDDFDCDSTVDRNLKVKISTWLTQKHSSARGFELGSIDPSLLTPVFRGQSEKWERLAKGYVCDVIHMVHTYVLTLLRLSTPSEAVKDALLAKIQENMMQAYKDAYGKVDFLLFVEQQASPTTANHYFNDILQKIRSDRFSEKLKKSAFTAETNPFRNHSTSVTVVGMDSIDAVAKDMSNKEHVIRDFHDILQSYYKVALKRFVDNVIQQSVHYHLIYSDKSPLKIFCATFVNSLSDDELEEIAGEDLQTQETREALTKVIETLEAGKKVI